MRNNKFLFSLIFFAMGFLHISFSLFGLICMLYPFIDYKINRRKKWCSTYCPRKSLLTRTLNKISLKSPLPKILKSEKAKEYVFNYFLLNLSIALISTFMVFMKRIPPIEEIRFIMIFKITDGIWQFTDLSVPLFVVHLGYRIYSMLFSSLVVGVIMALIWKPQTWCSICPVTTWTRKDSANFRK